MEKLPEKKFERKSGFVRILGIEEAEEQKALEIAGQFFKEKQKFLEEEVKKTAEQKELIAFISQKLPEFVKRYGGDPLVISEDKIHILPDKYFSGQARAFYHLTKQNIYIRNVSDRPLIDFAKSLVHEELHWNSFQSIQFGEKEEKMRRAGFKIVKGQESESAYFKSMNEAVIEELTKRFCNEFFKQAPVLKEEVEKLEAVKRHRAEIASQSNIDPAVMDEWLKEAAYVAPASAEENAEEAIIHRYAYVKERRELNQLIAELYENNKNDFQSEEEVFILFAKAVLNGRLLPVARLVEKTFGKGAFRKLGEHFGGKMEKIII